MMDKSPTVAIRRTRGFLIHGGAAVVLLAVSGIFFWQAARLGAGPAFIRNLVFGILFILPFPLILYRLITLLQAAYLMDRNGLRLRWGMRAVDIPLRHIEWIRRADDLIEPLPIPLLHFSGFLRGVREIEGLGRIEFMATDSENLLMVATPEAVFILSPVDIDEFALRYQEALEMGSLAPLASASIEPDSLVLRIWADRPARMMLIMGALLSLALLVFASLAIPTLESVSLGFDSVGNSLELSPPEYLLLLPITGLIFFFADILAGAFFYVRREHRFIAYLLWGSSVISPALLLAATIFIIRGSG